MRRDEFELAVTVAAAREGDARAWDALIRRFTPTVRRVAKGFRLQPHDVDDVVQETFVSALEGLRSLRAPEAVGAWLATTARRHSLRAHQRVVRELVCEAPLTEDEPGPECLESVVVEAERTRVLRAAMRRLPARQREVLESFVEEPGRSYVELSEGLGMPIGSIGPTRQRGLDRLRRDGQLAEVASS